METLQLVIGIGVIIVLLLLLARFFFDEKIRKVLSEIIILLLLIECLCNAYIKIDYKHQIELQNEIIDLQNQRIYLIDELIKK